MHAALLSAGPSLLTAYDPRERFDVRIGVNAAAGVAACDWWACGDGQTFVEVKPIGTPVVFTLDSDDGRVRIHRASHARKAEHRLFSWPEVQTDAPTCWKEWSLTAGLVLAVDLGAERVDVFGHGPFGDTDCVGRRFACRLTNWDRVHRDWSDVCRWANRRGVEVINRSEVACV